ncbi:polyphosphate kinase 1 [Candidatus Viridilinea mediisalina]|uniref:Polyphosphate kinase n=1 Tax=Candidatus Viridilinea mediisalina TaxID=2024553 RepID=A0A2A6RJC2_9CHLR|nr:polyphosphate kinase 1 [Candidatus Viridilinea mediisalina]PDW02989.1 polyphosphate kinase 1 [Candidatus Viridilinea mediisalina]
MEQSPEVASAVTEHVTSPFLNRELSWIEFNRRVFEEACDHANPLLERVKFFAIWASNLDEFFMIRVSGIKQQISAEVQKQSPDGLTPSEQLASIRRALLPLIDEERRLLLDVLLPELREQGITLYNYDQLNPRQRAWVADYFQRQIFPVLTPLAFDSCRPFPFISNLSINLAAVIQDPHKGELFARVKVPEVLPRLVALPADLVEAHDADALGRHVGFIWIEQVIAAHLDALFPGVEVIESYPFRVIRNADMEIEEDEADDLLATIEQGVRQRRFGEVVRLTIDDSMPERIAHLLQTNLKIGPTDCYTVRGPLALTDLMALTRLDRPDLKAPIHVPVLPMALRGGVDIFEVLRNGDVLLHHPYHTFAPVIDFINTAAEDPDVLAIKQTLYRVGSNSPIVRALMHARELGKQVTAVVELKARFDEENNIIWARALERAGVHVIYGLVGVKVHAKLSLVVRQEQESIRCYAHLGTGNYNAGTARAYTDLGLLTCRPEITADVVDLFNTLTAYGRRDEYRKLLIAPVTMRRHLRRLIRREIERHQLAGDGHLIFKMNSLVDRGLIKELYRASQVGVRVDLIVRGMCSLRPGVTGMSETIHVRSIIGPFLEHHRIYYFHNGGESDLYLGSADLMERNLDRRVEELFPLEDPSLAHFVRHNILASFLNDNVRARILLPDGRYQRLRPGDSEPCDSQAPERMIPEGKEAETRK